MELTFLGTAAAEGVPAVFCNCPTCRRAKARRGKDIRTRSQILIDSDTLFDFPMDTYMHMLASGIDLSAVKRVLITHAHMDHCYPQEFVMRGAPFAHGLTEPTVTVFCDDAVREIFAVDTAREIRPEIAANIDISVLKPFDRVTSGDMEIIALPACHTKGEDCLVYYIEREGKGALLLNDTGVLGLDVYKKLAGLGAKADIVTFDCTYGPKRHGPGRHMGLYDNVEQVELMQQAGLIKPNTVFVATHFSHNIEPDHEELSALAAAVGMIAAYDGMKLTV